MEGDRTVDAGHVRRVHVVFKTHLDVGFTDLAAAVVERYHGELLPRALAVADELAAEGEPFCWTTGSWLIVEHLERLAAGGDRAALARFEAALADGTVAWHALPFTTHTELLDASLLRHGLSLSARLDARFGRRTVAAKLTDVPGHTRALVPALAEAGVSFLHVGVNPASHPPDVPPTFRWLDRATGAEVVVRYHGGGYGDLAVLPGLADALAFAHSGDNDGPPSADDARRALAELRARFPDAEVRASTLDGFARALAAAPEVRAALPVVTAEIGDTWIHGAASDPTKLASYRALLRLRARWLADGRLDDRLDGARPVDEVHDRFSRPLLLVAEHTWGLDEKTWLPDGRAYDPAGTGDRSFAALAASEAGVRFASSWAEQRTYLDDAVAALAERPALAAAAHAALAERSRSWPDPAVTTLDPVTAGDVVRADDVSVAIDPATGAITHLELGGRRLADADHPLGWWRYQTFDAADYARFRAAYNVNAPEDEWWARHDFAKEGIDEAGAVSRWWPPAAVRVRAGRTVGTPGDGAADGAEDGGREDHSARLVVAVELVGDDEAVRRFGHPAQVVLRWSFGPGGGAVELAVEWSGRRASRFPQAAWCSFAPLVDPAGGWRLDKLGAEVDPLDVVAGGGRRLHAVGGGARHRRPDGSVDLELETVDAALVAPGQPGLLRFDDEPLDLAGGLHVLLHDNVWGTNFPMWADDDERFRFRLVAG